MQEDRWLAWAGLIIVFVIFRAVRGVLRAAKNGGMNSADGGMARLNAAAERILKQRGASVANPIPRTTPKSAKTAGTKSHATKSAGTPRLPSPALLPKSTSPAVIRRGAILSGREPVVQRRR